MNTFLYSLGNYRKIMHHDHNDKEVVAQTNPQNILCHSSLSLLLSFS